MLWNVTLLVIATLLAEGERRAPAPCERAVVHSLDPQSLYRTARTVKQVIRDGATTEVADCKWIDQLSARIDGLHPGGKEGLLGDVRLVAVIPRKERKPVQIAVSTLCQWIEIDGKRAPFDPGVFGLLIEKLEPAQRTAWLSSGSPCTVAAPKAEKPF